MPGEPPQIDPETEKKLKAVLSRIGFIEIDESRWSMESMNTDGAKCTIGVDLSQEDIYDRVGRPYMYVGTNRYYDKDATMRSSNLEEFLRDRAMIEQSANTVKKLEIPNTLGRKNPQPVKTETEIVFEAKEIKTPTKKTGEFDVESSMEEARRRFIAKRDELLPTPQQPPKPHPSVTISPQPQKPAEIKPIAEEVSGMGKDPIEYDYAEPPERERPDKTERPRYPLEKADLTDMSEVLISKELKLISKRDAIITELDRRLDGWLEKRKEIEANYQKILSEEELKLIRIDSEIEKIESSKATIQRTYDDFIKMLKE
jgi:hypothetical protein